MNRSGKLCMIWGALALWYTSDAKTGQLTVETDRSQALVRSTNTNGRSG